MILSRPVSLLALAATALILTQFGCKGSSILGTRPPQLELSSPNWSNGSEIPAKFTCDGDNVSPTLWWSSPPPRTQSLVLTFSDPYWLVGPFSHWVLYDLSPETRQLPEAVSQRRHLPGNARQGQNDLGRNGYSGPCPNFGSRNRYVFRLYALDAKLNLPPGASQDKVEKTMRGHILAKGLLIAPYSRPHK